MTGRLAAAATAAALPAGRPPWRSWAVTHVGAVRTSNEDALVDRADAGLWAVADGAGGHQHGEVASGMLAQALGALPAELDGADFVTEVRGVVASAHQALRARADAEAAQSGGGAVTIASTIVLLLASGPHFACLWAGDSRAYLLRDGVLTRLTRDHSLVQALIDQGTLTEAEAERHPHANVITRAVGADGPEPELDKVTGRAEARDRFLLCSDGLTKTLDEATLAMLLAAASGDPARGLVAAALRQRASDNVTAVVIEFDDAAAAVAANGTAAADSTAADDDESGETTRVLRPPRDGPA